LLGLLLFLIITYTFIFVQTSRETHTTHWNVLVCLAHAAEPLTC